MKEYLRNLERRLNDSDSFRKSCRDLQDYEYVLESFSGDPKTYAEHSLIGSSMAPVPMNPHIPYALLSGRISLKEVNEKRARLTDDYCSGEGVMVRGGLIAHLTLKPADPVTHVASFDLAKIKRLDGTPVPTDSPVYTKTRAIPKNALT